jgi:hypothetical protein
MGDARRFGASQDLREAIQGAAWAIGLWAAYGRESGEPPPEWAFEACEEYYLGATIAPRLLDERAKGPQPTRRDLRRLLAIGRILSKMQATDGDAPTSIRSAILSALKAEGEGADEVTIRRLTDYYSKKNPRANRSPDDNAHPAIEIALRKEVTRRAARRLREEGD